MSVLLAVICPALSERMYISNYIVYKQTNKQTMKLREIHVRFEVLTAVTMMNSVFRDVTKRGSWKKRRFGGT
jgi:hypothetical protein